ncbi:YfhO family protein [Geomonas sp. RF6]|uniref:YfhO family protein n=1 Tax=Geomonas sp. RF6 TaxID=2897342 RepID=UPI001E41A313|nr:YfhO family protein [Geomonas sp. RF6]UFS72709.1 YfhO family protein [Geomonas sp. RF6]
MTDRKKDLLALAGLLAVLLLCFSRILFTHQIIRAPDIQNEYYWYVLDVVKQGAAACFHIDLSSAGWDMLTNGGTSVGGGTVSLQFMNLRNLIYQIIPPPTSVAWFIVLHLWFGAIGTYLYCRIIGASRLAASLAGLIFAVAPEQASLVNAGHVMKIATIVFAPWAFYLFEKGFKTRRCVYFLATGFLLAFQFFNIHWQIAYYTCLAIGTYGVVRSIGIFRAENPGARGIAHVLGLNVATMVFFLTTVAISLLPLADWSTDTNRGANSGANVQAASGSTPQAKGGLAREEAMSWSLPPEEVAAFVIPGMFGLSRQEGGENPKNIDSYYWGRMNFTQTVSYMGLLPWLLLPLPLMFRRDRYTLLAMIAVVGGILFSMGKYTPFYNLLFDYFPGINRFRVPKMIMFIPVLGLGVLSALGLDLLLDPAVRGTRAFKRYVSGIAFLPVCLLVLLAVEHFGRQYWIERFIEMLAQPTRYEPSSEQLVMQRWGNLTTETAIAAGLSALFAAAFLLYRRGVVTAKILPVILLVLFLGDVGRINSKFLFLVDAPHRVTEKKPAEIEFLAKQGKEYRTLPMGSDPMPYVSAGVPVMFTSNAVQQRRWQEFLDSFNPGSAMPDIMNVRYFVFPAEEFEKEKAALSVKFAPVFQANGSVIAENKSVLPKAWLVPAVALVQPQETISVLQNPAFDPRRVALVESAPPIPMIGANDPQPASAGETRVTLYQGERIEVDAAVATNSMLVLGEKYYRGWQATVDGKSTEIYPVNHVLRGIYLTPGVHKVVFVFDPVPFKVGKYVTLASFAFFALMLGREVVLRRRAKGCACVPVQGGALQVEGE